MSPLKVAQDHPYDRLSTLHQSRCAITDLVTCSSSDLVNSLGLDFQNLGTLMWVLDQLNQEAMDDLSAYLTKPK